MDYLAEVFDLYLALMHANIPTDFVDEETLTEARLDNYRVLYVTAPNVPIRGQEGLKRWVQRGGTLVTVSAAATRDRYDEPTALLDEVRGVREAPRDRLLIPSLEAVEAVGQVTGEHGNWEAFGVKGTLEVTGGERRVTGGERRVTGGERLDTRHSTLDTRRR
jgi:hypothetical protein